MKEPPNMEIKPLTNIPELGKAIFRYERNTLTVDEIHELLNKHFVLGYEVWVDGECKCWAFALKINGIYTLDGHNYGVSVFSASRVGKMVVNDLFKLTTLITTCHATDNKSLHAVVKRVGFKYWTEFEDKALFYMVKQ